MATRLTDQNFASEVLNSDQPYLVDFWAPWCGPCRMVGPLVDAIAQEYQGRLKVGKLNVDEAAQVAGQYGIMSIPTLAIFKGGTQVASMVGGRPKAQLAAWIEENI